MGYSPPPKKISRNNDIRPKGSCTRNTDCQHNRRLTHTCAGGRACAGIAVATSGDEQGLWLDSYNYHLWCVTVCNIFANQKESVRLHDLHISQRVLNVLPYVMSASLILVYFPCLWSSPLNLLPGPSRTPV